MKSIIAQPRSICQKTAIKSISKLVLIAWLFSTTGGLLAANNYTNFTGNVNWSVAGNWGGTLPTASDNAYVQYGANGTLTVDTAAVAATLQYNFTNNITEGITINDGKSLTIGGGSGAITKSGTGTAKLNIYNSTSANAATVWSCGSFTGDNVSLAPGTAAGDQYLTTSCNQTIGTQLLLSSDPSHSSTYDQTGGTITIASGAYGLVLMEALSALTAGKTYTYILDGGILQSDRIGSGNGNGNNTNVDRYIGTGIFQFNNGTITNRGSTAVYFQNGNGYYAYPGSGIKDMQLDTAHPLTVQLAATGMHEFSTASGASIYFTPSVSLVDKAGGAGTLLKDGAGTLVFTGGGSVATNTWSGNTTNSAGTILVDYSQIAGMPASGGTDNLTNGYSPASQLVLNGGNFTFTGRANASAGSATGVSLAASTFNQTVTSTSGLVVGQSVSNPYLPSGTYIRSIPNSTTLQLNAMSTNTAAQSGQTLTFGAGSFANSQVITNVLLLTNATVTVNPAGSSTLLTFVNITNGGAGTNTFTKAGTGTLSLTGNLNFTGTNTIAISAGTLDFATANNLYMTNTFTGSGVLSHSGSGTQVIVSNANSGFTGSVVVSGGTLQIGNSFTPLGLQSATSYTVSNNATLALNNNNPLNNSASVTVVGATITNMSAAIIKYGPLTLNNAAIWTGSGISAFNNIELTADVAVNGPAASIIYSSAASKSGIELGTDTGGSNVNGNRTINVSDPAGSLTVGAPLVDAHSSNGNNTNSLVKTGTGLLSLSGTNAYRGSTTISNGLLSITGAGNLGLGNYSGNISNYTALIFNTSAAQILGGVITGTGALTNTGAGQLTLAGNNTYSGNTTISGGSLVVSGQVSPNSGTGSGNVAVNAGGTLSGNGRISGAVTVANNATAMLYPNNSVGGTLTLGGTLAIGASSAVKLNLSSSASSGNDKIVLENQAVTITSSPQITINSAGTLSASDYVLIDAGSGAITGSFSATPNFVGTSPKYAAGYTIVTGTHQVTLHYTPIAITVAAVTNTKTYDGLTTAAATPSLTGSLATGDTGTFTETYASVNAGTGNKILNPTAVIKDSGNNDVTSRYNITYTAFTTGTISQRPITVTAHSNTKIYDGSTSATNVPTLTAGTLVGGEGFSTLAEHYSDATVGTGKTLIPSATITNSASADVTANYSITPVNDTTGVINPAQVTTSLLLTNSVGVTNYYGQTLVFTAVVQTNSVTAANASSNVVFSLGSTPVWTNAVVGGLAYYTNDDQTVGVTNFTAQYLGDGVYLDSSVTVTQTVLQTTPTLTVTSSNITYGAMLVNSLLTGSVATNAYNQAGVAGSFTFATSGIVPNSGSTNVSVIFTPSDTTDYNSVTNNVTVTVNPATSGLTLSSSNQTNGYLSAVYFTATVPTNSTGSVIFVATNGGFGEVISTNNLTNGQAISLTITNLPRGTNIITAEYMGDSNYQGSTNTLSQYVTNHPPVAAVMTVVGTKGVDLAIALSDLATNWTDADGDPISLTGVSLTTTNGVLLSASNWVYQTNGTLVSIVTTNAWSFIFYSGGPSVADQISYSINDGHGGTNIGYINIALDTNPVVGTNSIASYDFTNGVPFTITAYGVIGQTYITQRSTNLTDWANIATNVVNTNGVINVSDYFIDLGSNAPSPLFYRLKWQSP